MHTATAQLHRDRDEQHEQAVGKRGSHGKDAVYKVWQRRSGLSSNASRFVQDQAQQLVLSVT